MTMKLKFLSGLILIAALITCSALLSFKSSIKSSNQEPSVTLLDSVLKNNILKVWYPFIIDSADGGYFSNATFDWKLMADQPKMLVTQSRHVWTSSQAAMFYNDSTYTTYARQGFKFLTQHMWDKQYGGFFNIRSKNGGYTTEMYQNKKMAYGNVFAIYGLTSYYNLTKDTTALDFAKRTFLWLEKHSHDKVYGGYVDAMDQDGTWLSKVNSVSKNFDLQKTGSLKDYNSSIHLLEAFTELYKVWPDPLVRTRLNEMLILVRDTFTNDKGYLNLNFTENWKLVSNRDSTEEVIHKHSEIDHISFGHDVETAFLLLEASYA